MEDVITKMLPILRCPQDQSELAEMSKRAMTSLKKKIDEEKVSNGAGELVTELPDAVLIREDKAIGYPVLGGVALLNSRDALILKS